MMVSIAGCEHGHRTTRPARRLLEVATLAAAVACGSLVHAGLDEAMNDFKAGRYVEAAAGFQALVNRAPSYDFGYFMLGLSYFKLGRNDEAVANLQRAIELDGDEFNYYHALAGVKRAGGRSAEALAALNAAEALVTPSNSLAFHSLRGFVRADLGKWAAAVDDLEQARAEASSSAVLEVLGIAYFKLGRPASAAPILRAAAALNPNNADTQRHLADSLIAMGQDAEDAAEKAALFSEAVQVATRYRDMRPEGFYGWNLVGKAALGAGAYEDAERAFDRVLELKPDWCYAMVNLARTFIARSEWTAAERASRDAIECAPRLAAGYESLGFALHKQVRLQEARAAYLKAQEIKTSPSVERLIESVDDSLRILETDAPPDDPEGAAPQGQKGPQRR
jgi:tetratricopeptide (TPR) repeat protein